MAKNSTPPWATGPGEILRHAMDLLRNDSDVNRRLAMISIDNAVELMLKTYLGLPRRVTGLAIPRRDQEEFSQSFPKLLDAAETYVSDKLVGINVGEIEWYHRLRNELYHQGNGLTVEREKVEVYAELANLLFANLFGFPLIEPQDDPSSLLGDFMAEWIDFERVLDKFLAGSATRQITSDAIRQLRAANIISADEVNDIMELRLLRNDVIHGRTDHAKVITPELILRLRELTDKIRTRLNQS